MPQLIKPIVASPPMTAEEAATCVTVDCILEYAQQGDKLKALARDASSANAALAEKLRSDMQQTAAVLRSHGLIVVGD